jgi:ABC-type branched-subunit amino acid transport system ATPase component
LANSENGPALSVTNLSTWYGNKQVLAKVNIHLARSEVVCVLGHNGAGKSTLLKASFGLVKSWTGAIAVNGAACNSVTPLQMIGAGVAYVAQGNRVFSELTVDENLDVCMMGLTRELRRTRILNVYETFAVLHRRRLARAGNLSGGEKQLLALACALIKQPQILLLDEPSLGLAQSNAVKAFEQLRKARADYNLSILLVEHRVRDALAISDRAYILRHGEVAFEAPCTAVTDVELKRYYL